MSKIVFLGDASGLHGTATPRSSLRHRRRRQMTTADKVKAIVAGIVIGLMLAAPVLGLVAAVGGSDPVVFPKLSPWSFGAPQR